MENKEDFQKSAKRINFLRKCCLVLQVGAQILRVFIKNNVPNLEEKDLKRFLQNQTKQRKVKSKSQKLLKLENQDILEWTNIGDWDLSLLRNVYDIMNNVLNFDHKVNLFAHLLSDERNNICHASVIETLDSSYKVFLTTFDSGLEDIHSHFEDGCFKDFEEEIAEIKATQMVNLERKQLYDAAKFTILMNEWHTLKEEEKQNKIEELKKKMIAENPANVILKFETTGMEDLFESLMKWMIDTTNGQRSEALRNILKMIHESTGATHNRTKVSSLLLKFAIPSSKNCIKLLHLMDSEEMKNCMRRLATEISEFIGKSIHLTFDTIYIMHQPIIHGSQERVKVWERESQEQMTPPKVARKSIRLVIRSFDNDRTKVGNMFNNLERAIDKAKDKGDLWQKIAHHFAKFQKEISHERNRLTTVKILVAGEKDSGANSFLNFIIGQNIFPAANATNNAMIFKKGYGLEVKSSTQTETESASAHLVKSALSSLRGCESKEKYKNKDDIIIVWPYRCNLLQDKIEWIIMPEDWEKTSSSEMLRDADGLIYIANSGSTKGPDHEKLKLISEVRRTSPTIILNKWDHVDYSLYAAEAKGQHSSPKDIQGNIVQHLRQSISKLDENETITFSVMQAAGFIDSFDGMDLDQEDRAKNVLQKLMESSIKQRLDNSKAWILKQANILKKGIDEINSKAKIAVEDITNREKTINVLSNNTKWSIDRRVKQETENTSGLIVNHIKSESVRNEMNNWEYDDFPCSLILDSKDKIRHEVNRTVTERLGRIIARDMRGTLADFKEGMLAMVKTETGEVKRTLETSHEIISRQNVDFNLHTEIRGDLFKGATLWDGGLRSRIDLGLLLDIFLSPTFIAFGLFLLPFVFFISFFTDSANTIHVKLLRQASEKLIDSIDQYKIAKMIDEQLGDFKKGVNVFFTDVVPQCTNELDRVKVSITLKIKINLEIQELVTFE